MKQWLNIRYWCQDESRFGLHTIRRRKLTARGIKPKGAVQRDFIYLWLYGVVEPTTGETFFYEFSHLDTACFEKFLELFSQAYPDDLHLIQLDNGAFHQSLTLSVPENVVLLFQPPYTPEVNPIERLWEYLKNELKWETFDDLNSLRTSIQKTLSKLTSNIITSLTGWRFILDALSVAGI